MKQKWKKVLWICVFFLELVKCDFFSVVAPAILRADEFYRIALTSHSLDANGAELLLTVGIEGWSQKNENINFFRNLSVPSGQSKIFRFKLPDLMPGHYNLKVIGENFARSAQLFFHSQRATVMIQLAKATYKTTDIVNFRVFAVNLRTKPYKIKNSSRIWIIDQKNNEIKTWEQPQFEMGSFDGLFRFNDLEAGMYEILAEIDGTISSKMFEITENTRSLYEIDISVPEVAFYRDGFVDVKVKLKLLSQSATRSFNGNSGKLVLTCDELDVVKFKKTLSFDRETNINIDFLNDLNLRSIEEPKKFNLKAEFFDPYTEKVYTDLTSFTIEMSDYAIYIVHSPEYFKANLPYEFTILVVKVKDQSPLLNSTEPIHIVIKDDEDVILMENNFPLDSNTGSVEIRSPVIDANVKSLRILANFDMILYWKNVYKKPSLQDHSITINVLTAKPKMYELVEFEILTTSSVPSIVFQIISKGILKLSKVVPLINKGANFTIIPKFSYTPKSHCIAFFIDSNGEIISDSITLSFETVFPNYVNLSLNTLEISPGSDFALKVTSTLNSSVSLLAIDQRAAVRRNNFDISENFIFNTELVKYDELPLDIFNFNDIPFWFYPFSYQKKFLDVGAVVITNAQQNIPCYPTNESLATAMPLEDFYMEQNLPPANENQKMREIIDSKQEKGGKLVEGFLFRTLNITHPINDVDIIGEETIIEKSPSVQGTWLISALTISEKHGIGLTSAPITLDCVKNFYLDFSLPLFIKVNEIVLIEIIAVNLFSESVHAYIDFTSDASNHLSFLRSNLYGWTIGEFSLHREIVIPPTSSHRLRLELVPAHVGKFSIEVTATSNYAVDKKISTLTVVSAGFFDTQIQTQFLSMADCNGNIKKNLSCTIPAEVVDGSLSMQVTVIGDILGMLISNLDFILYTPKGNAEETLQAFASNVLVLDYLVLTSQLDSILKAKAIIYLEQCFQKLMKYRYHDGSFCSFGIFSNQGSVSLTANILKFLRNAQRYLYISENIFIEGLAYLASKQETNGRFEDDVLALNRKLYDGTRVDISFTSFIGILFAKNADIYPQYKSVVQKCADYVGSYYDGKALYSLALATYFFHEIDSPLKNDLFEELSHFMLKREEYVYWLRNANSSKVSALDIEITSYGLLTLDHIPEHSAGAFKAMQWLIVQQNARGGFQSTQDTILALEAISKFASRFNDFDENLEISLTSQDENNRVRVTNDTRLVLQAFHFHPLSREISLEASGSGVAIVQLSCNFFLPELKYTRAFEISTEFSNQSCIDRLILNVHIGFIKHEVSNIIVVNIELPSGYVLDNEKNFSKSSSVLNVKELANGCALNAYILRTHERSMSLSFTLLREFIIFNITNSNIKVYDFNDRENIATLQYKPPDNITMCENVTHVTARPIYEFTTIQPIHGFQGKPVEIKNANLIEEKENVLTDDLE